MSKWQPPDWVNPFKQLQDTHVTADKVGCKDDPWIFEAGASAMLSALIKHIENNYGDGHDRPLIQIGVQDWQDFKKEIGS